MNSKTKTWTFLLELVQCQMKFKILPNRKKSFLRKNILQGKQHTKLWCNIVSWKRQRTERSTKSTLLKPISGSKPSLDLVMHLLFLAFQNQWTGHHSGSCVLYDFLSIYIFLMFDLWCFHGTKILCLTWIFRKIFEIFHKLVHNFLVK